MITIPNNRRDIASRAAFIISLTICINFYFSIFEITLVNLFNKRNAENLVTCVQSHFFLFNHINYLLPIGCSNSLGTNQITDLFFIFVHPIFVVAAFDERINRSFVLFFKEGAKRQKRLCESSTVIMSYSLRMSLLIGLKFYM